MRTRESSAAEDPEEDPARLREDRRALLASPSGLMGTDLVVRLLLVLLKLLKLADSDSDDGRASVSTTTEAAAAGAV